MQSNDWWIAAGFSGLFRRLIKAGLTVLTRLTTSLTRGFLSEPFAYDFVDFPDTPLPVGPYGLRLWNQNAIAIKTDGKERPEDPFNPAKNIIDRGFLQPENQPVVTVGLENVHPLSQYLGQTPPQQPPWTKVRVRKLFGLGHRYCLQGMAPTKWRSRWPMGRRSHSQRTLGQANFLVWTGGSSAGGDGSLLCGKGKTPASGNVLGVTVSSPSQSRTTIFPTTTSKAGYLVIAESRNLGADRRQAQRAE